MKAFFRRGCLALAGAFVISMAGAGVAGASSYSTGSISRAIPDNGVLSIKINVPQRGHVQSMQAAIRAKHTCGKDITVHVESPSGKSVTIFNGPDDLTNCNPGNDIFGSGNNSCAGNKTIFDDDAPNTFSGSGPFVGRFQPSQPLGGAGRDVGFVKEQIQGTWHVFFVDNVNADSGTVGCVKLIIHHTSD